MINQEVKMTQVKVEIFRDSTADFKDKLNILYQLLPEGVKVVITESLVPFSVEDNSEATAAQLLSFEMQRLTENPYYRATYISTNSTDKFSLIEMLEAAGFLVIKQLTEA
jgi:hypothetical protein